MVVAAVACRICLDDDLDSENKEGLVPCWLRYLLSTDRPALHALFGVARPVTATSA